ncbi:glycosyltransferase [Methylobacterium sp. J-092]|uniref:glycosyltransferase n=1 Tax=Methylobacterium sp. J-092 TaxID=2836667 RepID=UPI001FB92D86|nr:glycosyltransferase [Methylobacterium sp. J-092]MCJ2010419.1 glycosyltransferase [Methylobacterium sp. J-092]
MEKKAKKLVDERFYLIEYPDVATQKDMDASTHYMKHGWREGRNPNKNFNTLFYRIKHSIAREENPLIHYVLYGEKKQLDCAPINGRTYDAFQLEVIRRHIDADFFIQNNYFGGGDVASDYFYGQRDGIKVKPRADFDTAEYLSAHSFLKTSSTDPYFHFLATTGLFDAKGNEIMPPESYDVAVFAQSNSTENHEIRRLVAEHFDASLYLDSNADVRMSKVNPLNHYIIDGWKESRNPNAFFWTSYYLASNPDVASSLHNPFYHYLKWGRDEKRRQNPIGDELWTGGIKAGSRKWASHTCTGMNEADVVVIMPVYQGYNETLDAIYSILCAQQKTKYHLIVIQDNSPDLTLIDDLRSLSIKCQFSLVENESNEGFVSTVNKGFSISSGRDVVIINSDTVVYGDWLDRLRYHTLKQNNVGTVTPFSNNATVFSYPDPTQNNVLAIELSSHELDSLTRSANWQNSVEVLTGVGFCMYITANALKKVGDFDVESFGKGYGEENDFCMRVKQVGMTNLHALDVFVYHKGQVSFGNFTAGLMSEGSQKLNCKHPNYDYELARWVKADPARNARRRLDAHRLVNAAGDQYIVLFHSKADGGIKTHLDELVEIFNESKLNVISVELDPRRESRLKIYLLNTPQPYVREDVSFDMYDDFAAEFFDTLSPKLFHIHSLGRMSNADLDRFDLLISMLDCPIYFTVHDFGSICLRYNFVREDGQFCNNNSNIPCDQCNWADKHVWSMADKIHRYNLFSDILSKCNLIAPSIFAGERLNKAFPLITYHHRPHPRKLKTSNFISYPNEDRYRRIVIIGAIGPHKGSDLVAAVASHVKDAALNLEFHIVGYSDIDAKLESLNVKLHGSYTDEDEAIDLIQKIRPHAAWLPSICPETYSYTLDIALRAGVPPIVFNLGAMAERVEKIGWGIVLPKYFITSPNKLANTLNNASLNPLWQNREGVKSAMYANILDEYYQLSPGIIESSEEIDDVNV